MIYAVYKGSKRPNTYLFLAKRDDFSPVPEELRKLFGTPQLITLLPESKIHKVIEISPEKLVTELNTSGYFLWVKAEEENLLKEHQAFMKKNASSNEKSND